MSQITVKLDLKTLPKLITQSANTCLAAHGIRFMERGRLLSPEETATRMRELGNNVAAVIAMQGEEG